MRMNAEYQIERIISNDTTRPHLCNVQYDVKGKRCMATNGHMGAIVPVITDPEDHTGPVTRDALKAARKQAKRGDMVALLVNGSQQVPGGPSFPRPTCRDFPALDAVMPQLGPDDPGTITIGLNAQYLLDLALALGADKTGPIVQLTIKLPEVKGEDPAQARFGEMLDPILVKAGDREGTGALMPIARSNCFRRSR